MNSDDLKTALGELGSDAARTARASGQISDAAAKRRDEVGARLDELRARTATDDAAAKEYAALVEERGQLDLVLGRARG